MLRLKSMTARESANLSACSRNKSNNVLPSGEDKKRFLPSHRGRTGGFSVILVSSNMTVKRVAPESVIGYQNACIGRKYFRGDRFACSLGCAANRYRVENEVGRT